MESNTGVGPAMFTPETPSEGADVLLDMLHVSVKAHDIDKVQQCIEDGVNVNKPHNGRQALCLAVEQKQEHIVKLLLEANADPNLPGDSEANLPLFLCAAINDNDQKIAKLLLSYGANTDPSHYSSLSALHVGIKANNGPFVRLLLEHNTANLKASYMFRNPWELPFYFAIEEDNAEMVKIFLDSGKGFLLDTPDPFENDDSPLRLACKQGSLAVIKLLLQHGVDPNEQSTGTPILVDICTGKPKKAILEVVKVLVEWGADAALADSCGTNCFHQLALRKPDVALLKYLWEKGVDIYAEDEYDPPCSPLHVACENVNTEFIVAVLGLWLDMDLCDKNGSFIEYVAGNLVGGNRKSYDRIQLTFQLLVAAGSSVPSDEVIRKIKESILCYKHQKRPGMKAISQALDMITWLQRQQCEPCKLVDICRLQTRQSFNCSTESRTINECIESLPIPYVLQNFLKFENLVTMSNCNNSAAICDDCWEFEHECTCDLSDFSYFSTDEEDM